MAKFNANRFKDKILEAAEVGLNLAAIEVEKHLKENTGLTDHSKEDLANLGYPYGKRNPQQIHDPDWLLHIQSGQLRNSISIRKEDKFKYSIGVDPDITDEKSNRYLDDVIEGTSKVRGRNFPYFTLVELETNGIIDGIIDRELDKVK